MSQNAIRKRFDLWPKQLEAFHSEATEILYGGSAGPGKSHLLRVVSIAWCMMIPGLQVYLFRRSYRDLTQGHMEGPTGFKSMLAEAEEAGLVQIVELEIRFRNGPTGGFDGGSRISLNHCQHEQDVLKYKTIEFHVLLVEEATEFTEFMIRFLRSRVRMPEIMNDRIPESVRGRFPRVMYATNPGGPGHGYFKRAFVDAAGDGIIWQASDEDGGFLRQFIRARLSDNPSVNPEEYRKRLSGIGSPAYVEALLEGSWDAPVGAFFTEFDVTKHIIPDHTPPAHFFRFGTMDLGWSEPFAIYWWAVSDGEPYTDALGQMHWYPRGALIAYREWYGCNPVARSEGLRMTNHDIADGILSRCTASEEKGLVFLTDSLPFQERGGKKPADEFGERGVNLVQGDDSRESGWGFMRAGLNGVVVAGKRVPMTYFCESCWAAREYIPMLPYHPNPAKREDAAEHGEATHAPDSIRIAHTARARATDKPAIEKKGENRPAVDPGAFTFNVAIKKLEQASGRSRW